VNPRLSVSAISTIDWTLEQDLAFYGANGIEQVGLSLAKLERHGLDDGVARVVDNGLQVTNLLGLGPFKLAEPHSWGQQQDRLTAAIGAAAAVSPDCLVLTTGPAGDLEWEAAADALALALRPVLAEAVQQGVPVALEHTNPLRTDLSFLHTLRDAADLARRLEVGVCLEVNACWYERDLATTIAHAADCIRLVQVSDFVVGTHCTPDRAVPGDGDIPLRRVLGHVLKAGYGGVFDLELIGPRIEAEGYEAAVPRAIAATSALLESLGAG
jgi:sugar phosphate isomerase/epimerase